MSHVFIAYKRADAARAAVVREKLEALGVSLFIDQHLISGENYLAVINAQLNSALAVLVLWSEASVNLPKPGERNFLIAEAQRGYAREIFVAAKFDKIELDNLPVPFNTSHASDLSDWIDAGAPAKHRGWQQLLEALAYKTNRAGLPELAIILENGSEEAKRKFLRKHPADPMSERFIDEIVAAERDAFERAMTLALGRVDRRRKDAEKLFKECRKDFERQLGELRAGRDFWPPDPVNLLDDNVAKLTDQIEIYESTIQELQTRAEQSETTASSTSEQIATLNTQIEDVKNKLSDAENTLAEAPKVKSELEMLKSEVANKNEAIAAGCNEIASLKTSVTRTQRLLDEQNRAIRKLQADNVSLRRRLPDEVVPLFTSTRFLIGSGLAAGLVLGLFLFPVGNGIFEGTVLRADSPSSAYAELQEKLDRSEKELNAKQAELLSKSSTLETKQRNLDSQALVLKARLDELRSQNSLAGRERVVAERELKVGTRENEVANKEKLAQANPAPGYNTTTVSAAAMAAECDEIAGAQFDLDRPTNSGWKDNLADLALLKALEVCERALNTARAQRSNPDIERRLLLEIGRILATQGSLQAKSGKLNDAQHTFDRAVDSLNRAAKLGSAHAYYILGTHYRGDVEMKGTPSGDFSPVKKDLSSAWDNFLRAADLGDPIGLTTVAFALLLPHWNDKIANEDFEKGRKYLDAALKSNFPRANFVLGLAKIEGKGFPKDATDGLKQISLAYCKSDSSAQRYVKAHRIKPPVCS